MSDPTAPTSLNGGGSHPAVRFLKQVLICCLLLTLAAVTLYLLSERNSRRFKLSLSEQGELIVLKGRMMPFGFSRWAPPDLQTAETYAPFHLDGHVTSGLDLERVYDERDQLDRVLFDLHREAIEQRSGREDNETVEAVALLLRRAERLGGISDTQKAALRSLQIRNAFFEGRLRLEEAVRLLQKAVARLRLASEGEDSPYTAEAEALLSEIKGHVSPMVQAVQNFRQNSVQAPSKDDAGQAPEAVQGDSPKDVAADSKAGPESAEASGASADSAPASAAPAQEADEQRVEDAAPAADSAAPSAGGDGNADSSSGESAGNAESPSEGNE